MDKLITINEASELLGLTKRTLRYYEEKGLISSIRKEHSSYRLYYITAISRLEQIIVLKNLQFSIDEIYDVITSKNKDISSKIIEGKLSSVQKMIFKAKENERMLKSIRDIVKKENVGSISVNKLMRELVYSNELTERMVHMTQVDKTMKVEVHFGQAIGRAIEDKKDDLIKAIKQMRGEIEEKTKKELPLIRIMDDGNLEGYQYQITINDNLVLDKKYPEFKECNFMDLVYPLKEKLCGIKGNVIEDATEGRRFT